MCRIISGYIAQYIICIISKDELEINLDRLDQQTVRTDYETQIKSILLQKFRIVHLYKLYIKRISFLSSDHGFNEGLRDLCF